MLIHVRFAEPFWRTIGQRNLELELDAPAMVKDLTALIEENFPQLSKEFEETPPIIFIGESEAEQDTPLKDGNRVHFVWPIAGGSRI